MKAYPFQIVSVVIDRISVDVVYSHSFLIPNAPCKGNEPRDKPCFFFSIFPERHLGISAFPGRSILIFLFHDSLLPMTNRKSCASGCFPVCRSDSAFVGRFIEPFISGNTFPLFHCSSMPFCVGRLTRHSKGSSSSSTCTNPLCVSVFCACTGFSPGTVFAGERYSISSAVTSMLE